MTRSLASMVTIATLLCSFPAQAAVPVSPPAKLKQANRAPCDTKDSPDYVPGIDAYGRPVAPADVPSGTDVVVSNEVYPELKSKGQMLRGTGLAVRIEGLGQPPECRPRALFSSPNKPRN